MVEILENETNSKKNITRANMIQTYYVYISMDSSLDELLSQFYKNFRKDRYYFRKRSYIVKI